MREGNEPSRAIEARTEPPYAAEALTDGELVAQARAGAAGAFREIMRRNNRRLYRAARSVLRDGPEAEDVVQEAYVRAFQGLSGFRGEANLSTWLTRIAYNEALGRVRRQRIVVGLPPGDVAEQGSKGARILMFPTGHDANGSDPEGAAVRREIRQLLEHAIDALPARFRTVLVARDVDGMSVEETAGMLNLRPQTVRTRLYRARRLLRGGLEERVGDALRDVFPFDGMRCLLLTGAVMARLGPTAGAPVPLEHVQ